MNTSGQEIEVKFYLHDLPGFEERLKAAGAAPGQSRVFESNLRFDLPTGRLTRQHKVLRLRKDERSRLTFKGPAASDKSVSVRTEIETEVADFEATRSILEALGYEISVMYEKWRTTYHWRGLEIVLDELPYGCFCEIEGPDAESIQAASAALGLDWEARITESYLALFERLKSSRGLTLRHLSFAELEGSEVSPLDLGLRPAD